MKLSSQERAEGIASIIHVFKKGNTKDNREKLILDLVATMTVNNDLVDVMEHMADSTIIIGNIAEVVKDKESINLLAKLGAKTINKHQSIIESVLKERKENDDN